ncbi:aldose 1-epimerase family protein [Pseudonocardia dioxanivorans]|uniref:Aldose 1-epimerase n=1 Tax=Pseudonocardia dioxanivorans (strain ATCC 55486 / DSM 44775 / JCM 13855 / CB1190) TaxID=675635 RepID=F4CJF6_PSEUX|nr:aldose 1-epimerase family protein [Pseudonocardia dioxanivorans]AEA24908.1 Aldose 1-epimerase [Pseudonocardia dioxanivorans CB1190]
MSVPPTGRQLTVSDGAGTTAVVTEVGAGLRAFEANGVAYTETWPETERPPRGCGALLAPWPNRVRAGRWAWQGAEQQLALTEPAAGNAIHGLLRHVCWVVDQHDDDAVTLTASVMPQPGWPQPVRVSVRYGVGAGGLTVAISAENLGTADVPFGVGSHPYLRVGSTPVRECTLELGATTAVPLVDQLPAGEPRPLAAEERTIALRDARLDDCFGGARPVDGDDLVRHRLTSADGGVELWADPAFGWVQVFTPDDLGGHGPAVAVEPMTCPPDALNSGEGLVVLAPGERWSARWGLRPLG